MLSPHRPLCLDCITANVSTATYISDFLETKLHPLPGGTKVMNVTKMGVGETRSNSLAGAGKNCGARTFTCTNTQTHKHTNTQTHACTHTHTHPPLPISLDHTDRLSTDMAGVRSRKASGASTQENSASELAGKLRSQLTTGN